MMLSPAPLQHHQQESSRYRTISGCSRADIALGMDIESQALQHATSDN